MQESDSVSSQEILPEVYEKLRRLAASRMFRESGKQTLQPTALVHEAWIRLSSNADVSWKNQAHFFGAASEAMRRILVDRSRSKAALKRQSNEEAILSITGGSARSENHILLIHESLKRLEKEDPESARIVVLKFYNGFTSEEIAEATERSVRSVERQWALAKAKLYRIIRDEIDGGRF